MLHKGIAFKKSKVGCFLFVIEILIAALHSLFASSLSNTCELSYIICMENVQHTDICDITCLLYFIMYVNAIQSL